MIALLLACTEQPVDLTADPPEDVVDVTVPDDALGELGPEHIVFAGPAVEIQPGEDVMICQFGTYTGPDVGMHDIHTFQGRFGHHFQLMGTTTPTIDVPDGEIVDCTGDGSGAFQMSSLEPIGLPNHGTVDGVESELSMPLPEGMAVELESGQRYVLQSHYLNSGSAPIRIGDKVVISTVPTEEVETWAAPLIFNRGDFLIPAGGTAETSFSCTTESDWNLLYMLGHMHEWGTSFKVEEMVDGAPDTFYDVPSWDPVYRDAPMVMAMTDAPVQVAAGTEFVTHCSWANDTAEDLVFPHEMCVAVSFVYPQKTTVICDGDGQ